MIKFYCNVIHEVLTIKRSYQNVSVNSKLYINMVWSLWLLSW